MKKLLFLFVIITGIAAIAAAQTVGAGAFRQEGTASWYGFEFDGKPTASGEIFSSALYTAAHPVWTVSSSEGIQESASTRYWNQRFQS